MKKESKKNLITVVEAVVGALLAYLTVGECPLLIPTTVCFILMLILPTEMLFEQKKD